MKYLKDEYDNKTDWDTAYNLWLREFEEIMPSFPKRFLKEFQSYHFHDNIIYNIVLEEKRKKGIPYIQYIIQLYVKDVYHLGTGHILTFHDVTKYKTFLELGGVGCLDWLYCEFLKTQNNNYSFELCVPGRVGGDGKNSIYIEYERLTYKKISLE